MFVKAETSVVGARAYLPEDFDAFLAAMAAGKILRPRERSRRHFEQVVSALERPGGNPEAASGEWFWPESLGKVQAETTTGRGHFVGDTGPEAGAKGVAEDVKGTVKEAAGTLIGNEKLEREGEAQQSKAEAQREVAEKEAEAEAARAEAQAQEAQQRANQ